MSFHLQAVERYTNPSSCGKRGRNEAVSSGCQKWRSLNITDDCEDDDAHELMRFRGNDDESVRRIEFYPPFVNVKTGDDGSPVPIPMIEFRFEEGDTVFALLQRMVSERELSEIEDSIITYADVVQCQDHEKLVKDVLSSAGIGFWTVAPIRVFDV